MNHYKYKVSEKDPATMTAAQINKELDKIEEVSLALAGLMMDTSRGWELFSETRKKYGEDWLSTKYCDVADRIVALLNEIELRFGSRVYRLPTGKRGFGPRK